MPRPKLTPEERQARKKAQDRCWRQKNRDKKLAQDKAYHHAHREVLLAQMRARHLQRRADMTPEALENDRAKRRATQRTYYQRHASDINAKAKTPERLACHAALMRAKREADPEGMRAYQRSWAAANPEKAVGKVLRYAKNHPERVAVVQQRRRARQKNAPRNDVTPEQRQLVISAARGVCVYCSHYNPDCKLCPKGAHKLTVDHIGAIAHGGSNTLHNLIACCRSCNSKKRTRPNPVPVQPLLL